MQGYNPVRLMIVLVVSVLMAACGLRANTVEPTSEPTPQVESYVPLVTSQPEAQSPQADAEGHPAQAFTAPITAEGQPLLVTGRILDVSGDPVPDARIEFWQTDSGAAYNHPNDPASANFDEGFQGFGSTTADPDGSYIFRTITPGEYGNRPRHIHVKVFQGDTELLTTQYYFAEDAPSDASGIGGGIQSLLLTTEETTAPDGTVYLLATHDVVVASAGRSGDLTLTDSQGEGPFYPVEDVASFDNDLANAD